MPGMLAISRIDQPLRQGEAEFSAKASSAALVDQAAASGSKSLSDRRISGFRILLPHLRSAGAPSPGYISRSVTFCLPTLSEVSSCRSPKLPDPNILDVAHRESDARISSTNQAIRNVPTFDFDKAAEGSKHGVRSREKGFGGRFRGRRLAHQGGPLSASRPTSATGNRSTGSADGVDASWLPAIGRCTGWPPTWMKSRRSPRAPRAFPEVDVALCLPATLIERAARAVPGLADRRAGRPFAEQGRPHRLHLGGDAHGRRRKPDALSAIPSGARRSTKAMPTSRQGRGGAGRRARRHPVRRRKPRGPGKRRRGGHRRGAARCLACPPASRGSGALLALPMSRSGRSAPARFRPCRTSPKCTPRCAQRLRRCLWRCQAKPCASSTADRSRPPTRATFSRFADVDGALVGGASLTAADFLPIVERGALRRSVEARGCHLAKSPANPPSKARHVRLPADRSVARRRFAGRRSS